MTQPPQQDPDPEPRFGGAEPGPLSFPSQPGYGVPGYGAPGYGAPGGMSGYPPPGQPYGQVPSYGSPYQPYPGGWNQYRYGKDPRLAEWWQRLVARIVDGIVIAILTSWAWIWAFGGFFHQFVTILNQTQGNPAAQQAAITSYEGHLIGRFLLVGAVVAVITFCYDWVQHGTWGQTLGKRVMGTVVVRASDWSKIGMGMAAGRAAVYTLPGAVPYAGGLFELLNELWLLWDQRRQCLHDKAAGTVVAKKALLAAPGTPAPTGYPGPGAPYPGYPGGGYPFNSGGPAV